MYFSIDVVLRSPKNINECFSICILHVLLYIKFEDETRKNNGKLDMCCVVNSTHRKRARAHNSTHLCTLVTGTYIRLFFFFFLSINLEWAHNVSLAHSLVFSFHFFSFLFFVRPRASRVSHYFYLQSLMDFLMRMRQTPTCNRV